MSSIVLALLVWIAICAYLIYASAQTKEQGAQTLCKEIRVQVLDSAERGFVTSELVHRWLSAPEIAPLGRPVEQINTLDIKEFITRRGYVKQARVYTSIDGVLHVDLRQREPMMRLCTRNGYNHYITTDLYVLPAQRYEVAYVPLVTGVAELPFATDYVGSVESCVENVGKKVGKDDKFLANLIKFVTFVRGNEFWSSFLVQIELKEGSGVWSEDVDSEDILVELVPRVGNQTIVLGGLDHYAEKLEKLMRFYRKGLAYEGWDRYEVIDLRFDGQVVCR